MSLKTKILGESHSPRFRLGGKDLWEIARSAGIVALVAGISSVIAYLQQSQTAESLWILFAVPLLEAGRRWLAGETRDVG